MCLTEVKKGRIAELLIEKGADINYCNKFGSAIHYCIQADNDRMFDELIRQKSVGLS